MTSDGTNDDPLYEVPLSRLRELTAQASANAATAQTQCKCPATAQQLSISSEERRVLVSSAMRELRRRQIPGVRGHMVYITVDHVLRRLGVDVVDDGTEPRDTRG